MYDQLSAITPYFGALTAASPVCGGYLSEQDCRPSIYNLKPTFAYINHDRYNDVPLNVFNEGTEKII